MSRLRRILIGAAVAVGVLALLWTVRAPVLWGAARWLDIGIRPRRADYVMILNGEESTRPFVAAAIVKARFAPHVLIAEVLATPDVLDGVRPPYHEVNRDVLQRRGIPARDITILAGHAATTYDEARALGTFLKSHPDARVLVVTNDYHTRRSRWAFHRALGDRAGQVLFVSAPTDEYDRDHWWRQERGVAIIASEYLKLAFYAACYGYLIPWLAACGCLGVALRWLNGGRAAIGSRKPAT